MEKGRLRERGIRSLPPCKRGSASGHEPDCPAPSATCCVVTAKDARTIFSIPALPAWRRREHHARRNMSPHSPASSHRPVSFTALTAPPSAKVRRALRRQVPCRRTAPACTARMTRAQRAAPSFPSNRNTVTALPPLRTAFFLLQPTEYAFSAEYGPWGGKEREAARAIPYHQGGSALCRS